MIISQRNNFKKLNNKQSIEICNECGKSVKFGTGLFVNRIADLNGEKYRKEMGKPFYKGDYICIICINEINKLNND